jgi:hypothetical protein
LIEAEDRNSTGAEFKEAGHAFLTRPGAAEQTLIRIVSMPKTPSPSASAMASSIIPRPPACI